MAPTGSPYLAEKHFSAQDLAERWNLSDDTIIDLFENEPGVVVIERPSQGRRISPRTGRPMRRYRTLRIPESVAERVHRRFRKE